MVLLVQQVILDLLEIQGQQDQQDGDTGPAGPTGGFSPAYGQMYTLNGVATFPQGTYTLGWGGFYTAPVNLGWTADNPNIEILADGIYDIYASVIGAVNDTSQWDLYIATTSVPFGGNPGNTGASGSTGTYLTASISPAGTTGTFGTNFTLTVNSQLAMVTGQYINIVLASDTNSSPTSTFTLIHGDGLIQSIQVKVFRIA